jgi:uncharacterized RDD family membrane protein YckC
MRGWSLEPARKVEAEMATSTLTRNDPALDTTVRLVTPERIHFDYPLAGPFRRSLAYLLDFLVILILGFLGFITATLLSLGSSAGMGILLAFYFALWWGYGAFCEAIFNGQTLGKRALSIRVVTDQGVPITGTQALLRNILWAFDGVFFGFIPAVACMVVTSKFQRLGDLAAGTMVMVEETPRRGRVLRLEEPAIQKVLPLLPTHIDAGPEMARALSDYVKHRPRFNNARREEMAAHLARPLRKRYNLPAESPGDAIVCALYHRVFVGS